MSEIKELERNRTEIWTQICRMANSMLIPLYHPASAQEHILNAYRKWHLVFWWHLSPAYCKTRGPPPDSKILLPTPGHHCWGHSTEKNPRHLACVQNTKARSGVTQKRPFQVPMSTDSSLEINLLWTQKQLSPNTIDVGQKQLKIKAACLKAKNP